MRFIIYLWGPGVVDHSARNSSRETNGYLINNLIYCRPVPTRLEENENGLLGPGRFDITYLLVQLRSNEIAVIGKQIAQSGRGCGDTLSDDTASGSDARSR